MYRYVVAFVVVHITVLVNGQFGGEDDFLPPDMESVPATDREVGRFLIPDMVAVDQYETRAGIDQGHLEPIRNHKAKKPRRTNLERITNHRARHGSSGNNNLPTSTEGTAVDVGAWKPESLAKVGNCRRGVHQPRWNETDCISCRCQSNQVHCQRTECATLECDNQIHVEGECCPTCPEKLCETSDGRRFQDGDEWHMDDCTFCDCSKGKVECSVEDCKVPHCKNPSKVPGRCCPVCLDTTCDAANGTTITAEDVWKEGTCTHCYCSGGDKKCDKERCPYITCADRHTPSGSCCEKCNYGVVDCVVSEWGPWSECEVQECGGGMAKRYRTVLVPHQNGGRFCPHMSEARMCPRLPCDVLPFCPVTEWSEWGPCTATCGIGRKMRNRERAKTTNAPMTALIDCSRTDMEETKQCELGSCANMITNTVKEDPVYDDICFQVTWSEWSPCSSSECSSGTQQRSQVLINQSHPRGHLCRLLNQVRICECQPHEIGAEVVKCQVSRWGAWTPCSKTCGPGSKRTRHREVLQQPSGGGTPCPKLMMSKRCKKKACPNSIESFSTGDFCVTDDGVIKSHGDEWIEGSCASCRCEHSQILCQTTACRR